MKKIYENVTNQRVLVFHISYHYQAGIPLVPQSGEHFKATKTHSFITMDLSGILAGIGEGDESNIIVFVFGCPER